MPSFKTYDYGLTYINLDRVETISSSRNFLDVDHSYIEMIGRKELITVKMPLDDLLERLGIPVDTIQKAEGLAEKRRLYRQIQRERGAQEREALGMRPFEEITLERQQHERAEAKRNVQEHKPVQRERRSAKRDPIASASRTDQG